MATDHFEFDLPEPLRTRFQALVESTGRSESESAQEAIEEYLSRHAARPTCFEIAQKAGLIGCIEIGVGDLSTNPQHLEGFGS